MMCMRSVNPHLRAGGGAKSLNIVRRVTALIVQHRREGLVVAENARGMMRGVTICQKNFANPEQHREAAGVRERIGSKVAS